FVLSCSGEAASLRSAGPKRPTRSVTASPATITAHSASTPARGLGRGGGGGKRAARRARGGRGGAGGAGGGGGGARGGAGGGRTGRKVTSGTLAVGMATRVRSASCTRPAA